MGLSLLHLFMGEHYMATFVKQGTLDEHIDRVKSANECMSLTNEAFKHLGAQAKHFDGDYFSGDEASSLATARIEELQAEQDVRVENDDPKEVLIRELVVDYIEQSGVMF